MKYAEFMNRNHFEKEDLLAFACGTLCEDAPTGFTARLPLPPLLPLPRLVYERVC